MNDDFINGNVPIKDSEKWSVEDEWNIYIIRAVTLEDGINFDCYESEDNDHYGWIHCYNIELMQ